jgi:hypothetical protein
MQDVLTGQSQSRDFAFTCDNFQNSIYPLKFTSCNMVAVTAEYISIGCNKITQAAAWGLDGTVAYAADSLVAIYHPLVSKPYRATA